MLTVEKGMLIFKHRNANSEGKTANGYRDKCFVVAKKNISSYAQNEADFKKKSFMVMLEFR